MSEPELNSLVKLPTAIVEHLKDEPVLLGGMGAGSLIAIIAVFAPAGTQVYGWIVGGLMLVLCLGKLVFDARTAGARAASQSSQDDLAIQSGSNNIALKDATFKNNHVIGDRNNFKGERMTVEGTVFQAGTPRTRPLVEDGDTSTR